MAKCTFMGIALKAVYSLGTLSFPENETTCRASKMLFRGLKN